MGRARRWGRVVFLLVAGAVTVELLASGCLPHAEFGAFVARTASEGSGAFGWFYADRSAPTHVEYARRFIRIGNEQGLLRPGMNAEVEIQVAQRANVVAIPNAALRTQRDVGSAAQVLGLDPQGAESGLGFELLVAVRDQLLDNLDPALDHLADGVGDQVADDW